MNFDLLLSKKKYLRHHPLIARIFFKFFGGIGTHHCAHNSAVLLAVLVTAYIQHQTLQY